MLKPQLRKILINPKFRNFYRAKATLDYSKIPVLDEKDITEQFIKGSGPGGSNVNKTSNCVLLKHLPTGIVIKCHESRLLQENQEIARKILLEKLDNHYNGDMSISAQKRRIESAKSHSRQKKGEILRRLKQAFKNENQPN